MLIFPGLDSKMPTAIGKLTIRDGILNFAGQTHERITLSIHSEIWPRINGLVVDADYGKFTFDNLSTVAGVHDIITDHFASYIGRREVNILAKDTFGKKDLKLVGDADLDFRLALQSGTISVRVFQG